LLPLYLQNLHHETAFQAGMIQTSQALATLLILLLTRRFSDRLGSRPLALLGLILLISVTFLMTTLTAETAIWMVVGICILLGWANGLAQQIPVSAMSHIKQEEQQEVANGSTLITVLRAIAAPLGVVFLSSLVQIRAQMHLASNVSQTLPSELARLQSSLLALHDSFFAASVIGVLALAAMCFVPGRRKKIANLAQHTPQKEDHVLFALPEQKSEQMNVRCTTHS
jgi:MFS family permease